MNNILNITDQIEVRKRKRQAESQRHKIETLQRTVQCSSCHFRCAMCGLHFEREETACPHLSSPSNLNLCDSCRAEFEDFLDATERGKGSGIFWHNKEWQELWSAWLDYQKAIQRFKASPEFQQLIEALDDDTP